MENGLALHLMSITSKKSHEKLIFAHNSKAWHCPVGEF